jgi:hypothetical protein
MVGLPIIHIFTFDLSSFDIVFVHPLKSTEKATKKSYSLLVILLPLCSFVHQVASHHLHIHCVVFHLFSKPLLV